MASQELELDLDLDPTPAPAQVLAPTKPVQQQPVKQQLKIQKPTLTSKDQIQANKKIEEERMISTQTIIPSKAGLIVGILSLVTSLAAVGLCLYFLLFK